MKKLKSCKNIYINCMLKEEEIIYSKISQHQLGFDLYYALEYLIKKNESLLYFSLGTFYAISLVENKTLIGVNILNSIHNELKIINTNNKLLNNNIILSEEILWGRNNNEAISNGILKNKYHILKSLVSKNKNLFVSGYEIIYYDFLKKFEIKNIELLAMESFYLHNNFKKD
ncbi:MAG: hypothetical protein ACRCRZ_00910 [Metamycoplasmataceae bacterium]